jgi:hypothetical protein
VTSSDFPSTAQVARLLGVSVQVLRNTILFGRLYPPPRAGHNFVWRPQDVDAARKVVVPGRRSGRPARKAVADE